MLNLLFISARRDCSQRKPRCRFNHGWCFRDFPALPVTIQKQNWHHCLGKSFATYKVQVKSNCKPHSSISASTNYIKQNRCCVYIYFRIKKQPPQTLCGCHPLLFERGLNPFLPLGYLTLKVTNLRHAFDSVLWTL